MLLKNPKQKINQAELQKQWIKLYDEYWLLKDDKYAMLILRKADEIQIKKAVVDVLVAVYNGILALSFVDINEKTISQKNELLAIYDKNTKNKTNPFISYVDFLNKIQGSIDNLKNVIEKLEKENKQEAVKQIESGFDYIINVTANLPFYVNPKELVVTEFISYEKRIRTQIKQQKNG